jgi:hypothetical protein
VPLWASGQWLVDSGVRLLSRSDQAIWRRWSAKSGWSPVSRDPVDLPPEVAVVATIALNALVESLTAELQEGSVSQDDELNNLNDIDAAKVTISGLQENLPQGYMYGRHTD